VPEFWPASRRSKFSDWIDREIDTTSNRKLESGEVKQLSEIYNLSDQTTGIRRMLAPGFEARIIVGDQSMLSIVTVEPNAEGSVHSHPEEQWGILLQGSGIRTQDGVDYAVEVDDFWRTPGNVLHGFKAGSQGAKILDIFSPPREAYRKTGSGFATDDVE
jgi:quercetin dioxygenase-like cupin family protein